MLNAYNRFDADVIPLQALNYALREGSPSANAARITLNAKRTMEIFDVDWKTMFVPSLSLLEIFLRGTIMYLFLFGIMRILRRETGELSIADFLVVVIIADASQNAMAGEYKSLTDGVLLVATIAGWEFFLVWLAYHSKTARRILEPPPLLLIRNGQMLRKNMRKELVTEDDLMGQLRSQGVETLEEVKKCYMEGDGRISIIKKKKLQQDSQSQGRE